MRLQRITAVAHPAGNRIDLTWGHPDPTRFPGVRVVRREGTHPTTPHPASSGEGMVVTDTNRTSPDQPMIEVGEDGLYHVQDEPLKGETVYYYALFPYAGGAPVDAPPDPYNRTAAMASAQYNMAGQMAELLPTIYHRYDTVLPKSDASVADADRHKGQLRRFLDLPGSQLDQLYSFARAMLDLHNLDKVDGRLLPLLAQWIGWQTDFQLDIAAQRNEIKFAPHLYRSIGTAPNLQTIVYHYTGLHTEVAEFVQHIAHSNLPAQLNIFALKESPSGWNGTDDAAPILGFGHDNAEASGIGDEPARLESTVSEPFPLRPGMELAITPDRRLPMGMRFQPGDFACMTEATAAEVASAINRTLLEATATVEDGRLVLRSHRVGLNASLRVEQAPGSLVTLEGAPRGRLSAFAEADPATARIRLFYMTVDPQAGGTEPAAARTGSRAPLSTGRLPAATSVRFVPQQPQGHLRYKTFSNGAWGESHAVTQRAEGAQSDPAAVELLLPDGSRRIWLAWVDHAPTEGGNAAPILGFGAGNAAASGQGEERATLVGTVIQPFRLHPGMELVITVDHRPRTVNRRLLVVGRFQPGDFADITAATAAEVAIVLNRTLTGVTATARDDGRIELRAQSAGLDAIFILRVEQYAAEGPDAARVRFMLGTARATQDDIEWASPQVVTTAPIWRHADLYAMVTGVANHQVVWLFWAMHLSANWCIVSARWDSVTRLWAALEIIADGLGGNREPCAVLDQTNRIWVFWSRRQGVGTVDDTWTLRRRVFNPATDVPTWDSEAPVTTPPPDGGTADRESGVVRLPNGDLRVFFRSNRTGGPDLWSITVRPATDEEAVSEPSAITADVAANHAPTPLLLPDNTLWLLYRSDRSVPLARVVTSPLQEMESHIASQQPTAGSLAAVPLRSTRIVDTGTLRRFAGSTSLVPVDAARLSRHRLWDDLLAYTPQKPQGLADDEVLQDDDLYTRETVGLYVSQVLPDTPFPRQKVEQLRPLLSRFLPIHVHVVVIPVPRPMVERRILHANIVGQVSADPANLTSLQWRAYFPDPL